MVSAGQGEPGVVRGGTLRAYVLTAHFSVSVCLLLSAHYELADSDGIRQGWNQSTSRLVCVPQACVKLDDLEETNQTGKHWFGHS